MSTRLENSKRENSNIFNNNIFIASVGALLGLASALIYFRKFIFRVGLAFYADLKWPFSTKLYSKYFLWDHFTQGFNIANHVVAKSFLYLFEPQVAQRLIFIIIFVLMGLCSFYTIFKLTQQEKKSLTISYVTASVAAIFFTNNPVISMRLVHYLLLWFYAFLPIFFYLAHKGFEQINHIPKYDALKQSIKIALVLFLMSFSIRIPYFLLIFIFAFTINFSKPYLSYLRKSLLFTGLTLALFALFSSVWLLPLAVMPKAPSYYVVSQDSLQMLSLNSKLLKAVSLGSHWNTAFSDKVFYLKGLAGTSWEITLLLIALFAFSALILRPKNKLTISFSLFSLFIIFLAKGSNPPFTKFYGWFVLKSPVISSFGWQFRGPNKWNLLLAFSYTLLISISLSEILFRLHHSQNKWQRQLSIGATASILIGLILFSNYPALNGDMSGVMTARKLPSNYQQLNRWLEKRRDDSKVAVYPNPPIWPIAKPVIPPDTYSQFVKSSFFSREENHLGEILSVKGVKYLIFRTDLSKQEKIGLKLTDKQMDQALQNLKKCSSLKLVKQYKSLYIFENKYQVPPVFAPSYSFLSFSGVDILSSFAWLPDTNLKEIGLLFPKQNLNITSLLNWEEKNKWLLLNNYPSLLVDRLENQYLIAPFKHAMHHNPIVVWSKARVTDPSLGKWHPYLKLINISNWDLDYGKGLAFTQANDTLAIPIDIKKDGRYVIFARYLENERGGIMKITLDGHLVKEVDTMSRQNNFSWHQLGDFYLKQGNHKLAIENKTGFNAVNLLALIPKKKLRKYQATIDNLVKGKEVLYLFEGEKDLFPQGEKLILSSRELSGGQFLILKNNNQASRKIKIAKEGTYSLAVRYQGRKKISISLGEKTYNLPPSPKSLSWHQIDNIKLKKTSYNLELISQDAAIDLVAFLSNSKKMSLSDIFRNKKKVSFLNLKKINPTKYIVKLKAKEPFVLVFTESYDPSWVVTLDDGTSINSVPLYSTINGFYINKKGDLNLTIEYAPQKLFYLGASVSFLSILAALAYLTWSHPKTRNLFYFLFKR